VEVNYNDYDVVGAFAGASILAGLAIVTLILKTALEWKQGNR
jgi:sulfate transport system permease protein